MKYLQRNHIINVESNNVMSLAHDNAPGFVDHIPHDINGRPLGPRYGIGKWSVTRSSSVIFGLFAIY